MNHLRVCNRSRLALLAFALVPLLLVLQGCVQPLTQQGVPDDFSLEVAILPEAGNARTNAAQHFILHSDGTLRAGKAAQGALDTYPGQARKLSAAQMVELLNLARQALASAQGSTTPTQWLDEKPLPDGTAMLLWVRDSGEESATRFDSTGGSLPPAAENVRHRLQQLALMR